MKNISIRKVTPEYINQLQELSKKTFSETFAAQNTEENMKKYLEESFSLEKLTTELNDKNAAFYFAEFDSNIVGYIKLNFGPSQTELKDDKALEIERIYVIKVFQGKNVGQLLYEKAIEIAKQTNVDYVWLGVWQENARAIQFYTKNGFNEFDKHIFTLGNEEQTDIMMKLQLRNE